MALMLWVIAGAISTCGAMVMLEFGSGLPRSGGLKIYLERSFSPKLLMTCVYLFYCVFLRGFFAFFRHTGNRTALIDGRVLCKQRHHIGQLPPEGSGGCLNDLEHAWFSHRSYGICGGHPYSRSTSRTVVTGPTQRGEIVHSCVCCVHWFRSIWRAFANSSHGESGCGDVVQGDVKQWV